MSGSPDIANFQVTAFTSSPDPWVRTRVRWQGDRSLKRPNRLKLQSRTWAILGLVLRQERQSGLRQLFGNRLDVSRVGLAQSVVGNGARATISF